MLRKTSRNSRGHCGYNDIYTYDEAGLYNRTDRMCTSSAVNM